MFTYGKIKVLRNPTWIMYEIPVWYTREDGKKRKIGGVYDCTTKRCIVLNGDFIPEALWEHLHSELKQIFEVFHDAQSNE